jgi:formylglycine-generating enzyme required for sulfatase activity/serine/threonine protein kinase
MESRPVSDQPKPGEPVDSQIEAALREYLERLDRGEPVDREEFLTHHAQIAEKLRALIAAEDELRNLAGAESPLDRARDSTRSFVGHGRETIAPQSAAKQNADSGGSGLSGRFGRYRIIRALGKGAMGTVHLAEDTHIERQIALKTPHFTEDPTGEQAERFFREARAAGNLRHPNICPIYDFGQIDGKYFISMAYIEGRPLSAFIQPDQPQTERQILIVVRKLALALQEAHDHQIVHRDLKPANIMVDRKGEPIIMDFGLARHIRREDDIRLTQTGNIIGTPAYMSPEQVEGEPDKIGPATDQYSLGVILYELLTAQLPFRGSVIAVMGQILTKELTPPSQLRPDLDRRIEVVCLKMMAKTRSERFASLKAVADELAAILKRPAERTIFKEPPVSSTGPPLADRKGSNVVAPPILKSLKPKTVAESDLVSVEELARKCYSRRDFEQVIQIIERIPEERRSAGVEALLEMARDKADEIAFLICEIDEAERFNDAQAALKKAEKLQRIKPGHHRSLEIQKKFSGYGEGDAARIGVLDKSHRPLEGGSWIPWSLLAFGLAIFGVMTVVIVLYLGRTVVVIDIKDPGVEVAVKGTPMIVMGPDKQSVKVVPGDQELTITCAGFETTTKRFTIQKGGTKAVTVSIVNSKLVARLENEIVPLTPANEEQTPSATTGRTKPLVPVRHAPKEPTTATLPPRFKNGLGMEFVLVPRGKSWLGGGGGPPGNKEVAIANDFYLGTYEVTQEAWEKVTKHTPSWFSRTGGGKDMVKDITNAELKRFPVENVSWDDTEVFLEHLNKDKETGWVYRLPKEAEWEYACRGGPLSDKFESAYDFYFEKPTNVLFAEQANFEHGTGMRRTCRVGSYKPNRLGLYDMCGNVWEWCDDAEQAADGASLRVARGGCWVAPSGRCRAVDRDAGPPSRRDNNLGLRVARVPVGDRAASHSAVANAPQLLVAPCDEATAKNRQETWAAYLKSPANVTNSIGMILALIPAGEFEMGASDAEDRAGDDEKPQHRVRITKPYYLGVHEVTQEAFDRVMGRNPSWFSVRGGGKEAVLGHDTRPFPVETVSWYDAVEFCNKLSENENRQSYYWLANVERGEDAKIKAAEVGIVGGDGYRLPTEAEWEYACRAGASTPFHFGTSLDGIEANIDANQSYGTVNKGRYLQRTTAVGSYSPNAFGLYDMHGNIWEWCWDVYDKEYYRKTSEADPTGPSSGSLHVIRGGGWDFSAVDCRSAYRGRISPADRSYLSGFRVACSRIVGGSYHKTVKVRDAASGQEILTLKGHTDLVRSVAFSPDGKWIASGSGDMTVKVWDATSRQEILTLNGHKYCVRDVAFSPDGKRIASGSADNTIQVWNATSGQKMHTLKGHTDLVRSVAFNPDGKRIASASSDRSIRVWDATSGHEILTLKGHPYLMAVRSVVFSPDGKRIASGSSDRSIGVWDATSGQEILTIEKAAGPVAFSSDGKRIASGSTDNTVKVWDATSGKEMLTLKGHTELVCSLAFSPDGKRIASGSWDTTIKVWDASPSGN